MQSGVWVLCLLGGRGFVLYRLYRDSFSLEMGAAVGPGLGRACGSEPDWRGALGQHREERQHWGQESPARAGGPPAGPRFRRAEQHPLAFPEHEPSPGAPGAACTVTTRTAHPPSAPSQPRRHPSSEGARVRPLPSSACWSSASAPGKCREAARAQQSGGTRQAAWPGVEPLRIPVSRCVSLQWLCFKQSCFRCVSD